MTLHITASHDVLPEIARAIEDGVMDFNFTRGPMGDAALVTPLTAPAPWGG